MKTISVYLAGPDVFLPESKTLFKKMKDHLQKRGFTGISPLDQEESASTGLERAREIFHGNCQLMDRCELVLANCNSFRGVCVDDGTSFEIGYAYHSGKRIYGYLESRLPLVTRVSRIVESSPHPSGYRQDSDGYLLNEDFGNSINLMLEYSIESSGGALVEGNWEDAVEKMAKDLNL